MMIEIEITYKQVNSQFDETPPPQWAVDYVKVMAENTAKALESKSSPGKDDD